MEPLREVVSPYVDLETGEVIDPSVEITVKDLPQVGRQIAAIARHIEMIETYTDGEVDRIIAIANKKVEKLKQTAQWHLDKARELMEAAGHSKLDYPGIGRFRWRKIPVSVDSSEYDFMTAEKKDAVERTVPVCFREKTVVSPDKKAIKETLQNGGSVPGFVLTEPPPKFEFKAEE